MVRIDEVMRNGITPTPDNARDKYLNDYLVDLKTARFPDAPPSLYTPVRQKSAKLYRTIMLQRREKDRS